MINFFHFLNSVDLNDLFLAVLAIHLILSFLKNILVVCWRSPITLFLMFSISNFVIFPQMVLGYPREIVTVYGRGTLHSCGPTKLDKNKEYFLYGILFISNAIQKNILLNVWNINFVLQILQSLSNHYVVHAIETWENKASN